MQCSCATSSLMRIIYVDGNAIAAREAHPSTVNVRYAGCRWTKDERRQSHCWCKRSLGRPSYRLLSRHGCVVLRYLGIKCLPSAPQSEYFQPFYLSLSLSLSPSPCLSLYQVVYLETIHLNYSRLHRLIISLPFNNNICTFSSHPDTDNTHHSFVTTIVADSQDGLWFVGRLRRGPTPEHAP
jgi:hypothetical protein